MNAWARRHKQGAAPFAGHLRRRIPADPDDRYPVAMFGAEHGLTPAQVWVAQECLDRKRERLTGPRYAARIAGIISAVKRGVVGNSAWGWSMHGKRGGAAMARQRPEKLREIAAKGGRASGVARRATRRLASKHSAAASA